MGAGFPVAPRVPERAPAPIQPSWYGESVGCENGDTLVVDTIGLNDRTYVDNYRTPHTTQLHVVERFRLVRDVGGQVRVEDPGAFTMPWNAISVTGATIVLEVPLHEMVCENNGDHFRVVRSQAGRTSERRETRRHRE
jgi:hypothetical protein